MDAVRSDAPADLGAWNARLCLRRHEHNISKMKCLKAKFIIIFVNKRNDGKIELSQNLSW